MITNIELTDAGVEKFNQWFADVARPAVKIDIVMLDLLDVLTNRAAAGEAYHYELGSQYTLSGRPETITIEQSDVSVEECEDE